MKMKIKMKIKESIVFLTVLPLKIAAAGPAIDPNAYKDFNIQSVIRLVSRLACWMLETAIVIAGIMIIYHGVRIMAFGGSPQQITEEKKKLGHVLIGAVVVFGAIVIIKTVGNAVGANMSVFSFSCK